VDGVEAWSTAALEHGGARGRRVGGAGAGEERRRVSARAHGGGLKRRRRGSCGVERRWRRAGEHGSGGGCVGKRRREIEGKRRRLESGETERKKAGVRGQNTYMTGGTRDFL